MKMKVVVVFKGNNYLVWSRMVKTAVGSKGLWGHITSGTPPKPVAQEEDKDETSKDPFERWEQSLGFGVLSIPTWVSPTRNKQGYPWT